MSIWKKYGFVWVTGALFLITLTGHWIFGWYAYVNEQKAHQQPIDVGGYTVEMMRDTLENWQSEFLQLIWQVAGLALLLHVGSPPRRRATIAWKRRSMPFCSRSIRKKPISYCATSKRSIRAGTPTVDL